MRYFKPLIRAAIGFLVVFAVYWAITLTYWLLQPVRLPEIKEPITINNIDNTVRINEIIDMTLEIRKDHEAETIDSDPFIECASGNLITLAGNAKSLPIGEYTLNSTSYKLPPKVAAGDECKFVFNTTYRINPIKTRTQTWQSEIFIVKD